MRTTIATRLRPFSHLEGAWFLLPGSTLCVQVFPTRLEFKDLEGRLESFAYTFDFQGPIARFTAELDLEKGVLRVSGHTAQGFMRYLVSVGKQGVCLTMEKAPAWKLDKTLILHSHTSHYKIPSERLCLGMHKAQDWERMRTRLDLREIFPHWLRLSALIQADSKFTLAGNYALLAACQRKVARKEKEQICGAFEQLVRAGFDGVLVPRVSDSTYQGLSLPCQEPLSPLPLLVEGGRLIRSLFIEEGEEGLALLPCLPPAFHCGRMVGVQTTHGHQLDLEWTKKCLRKVFIQPGSTADQLLTLPKGIRSFRLTSGRQMFKQITVGTEGKVLLPLQEGQKVNLDRFEH